MTLISRVALLSCGLVAGLARAQGESVVGDYEALFPDGSELVSLMSDGAVRSSSSGGGRWTLEGRLLRLTWMSQRVEELNGVGNGRFINRNRGSTLTKQQAPVDLTAVIGLFDGQHPKWRGLVSVLGDGSFWVASGDAGRWTFNGTRLVLVWDRGDTDVLVLNTATRTFVRADGRFSLTRTRTAPLPMPAPVPPGSITLAPPPPPPTAAVVVDDSQVIGLFDVFNDRFADFATFAPNRTFTQGNGNTGTWSFDGVTLDVFFSRGDRQQFRLEGPGRFVGADRWFLIRRTTAPLPAPPPTLLSQASMPYRPVRVVGEVCPQGMGHVTVDEARSRRTQLCGLLDTWDIARLANGGSMDGRGYSCGDRPSDSRQLGHSLCRPAVMVAVLPPAVMTAPPPQPPPGPFRPFKATGNTCATGFPVSFEDASAHVDELCKLLGKWDVARIGQGSMDGRGYGCKLRPQDDRQLGQSLCRQ